MTPTPSRARLQELLGTEATQPLTAAEEAELAALLAAFPDQEPDDFELAAAALHLALAGEPDELPTALAEKLHMTAVAVMPAPPAPKRLQRPAWMAWSGWAIAAGLSGLLVYTALTKPKVVEVPVPYEVVKVEVREVPVKPPPEPTLAEKRDEFRQHGTEFAQTKDGLSASVAWSGPKQDGVLEVSGLPAIDPAKEQYQLWVFDKTRETKDGKVPPISAGVFDAKDGKALVPVRASLPVGDAVTFAISREPRGGLVQPTQVVLLIPAKVG